MPKSAQRRLEWHHEGMEGESVFLSPVPASPVKHPCPCCGYQTLREPPPGTFQTCPVCIWDDDNIQFEDPTYEGGANHVSLRQARKNFRRHGVSDRRYRRLARLPRPDEKPRLRSYYD
jgi:Cysteine-rich CPCC